MRILLAAQAGLFADAFGRSLANLAREVEVELCDPERLQDPDTETCFALVLIDADAAPGQAAALVHSCRERLPDVPIVALGSGLDEGLIAGILSAGRNVMGMMPHPERATEPLMGSIDGLIVFESMVRAERALRPVPAPAVKR